MFLINLRVILLTRQTTGVVVRPLIRIKRLAETEQDPVWEQKKARF